MKTKHEGGTKGNESKSSLPEDKSIPEQIHLRVENEEQLEFSKQTPFKNHTKAHHDRQVKESFSQTNFTKAVPVQERNYKYVCSSCTFKTKIRVI